jgi:hypothetical protein
VSTTRKVPIIIGAVCTIAFVVYALNFLYFFVDDEGIPFVYAQNLLGGQGLVYDPFDGPVEGYSDFLHVGLATVILASVKAIDLPKLAVFAIGKGLSLSAATAIIWIAFRNMRAMRGMQPAGALAGLAFLAFAGPLAVWSCSSLEPALFALLVTLLTFACVRGEQDPEDGQQEPQEPRGRRGEGLALFAVAAMLLCRIDGFVYATAILVPALWATSRERRWRLVRGVVLPALGIFAVYQLWRIWYFGELLPMPLYSKVLHKLVPAEGIIEKENGSYGLAFFQLYGWLPAVVMAAVLWICRKDRLIVALVAAAAMMTAYACIVGDWMFGFRFFVPVLPLIALLLARLLSEIVDRRPMAGRVLATVCMIWVAVVAYQFERRYEDIEEQQSWLASPSMDPARFFQLYYPLLLQARTVMDPGDTTAYNQAGFLPFMLKLHNIDDLGICSKFYAKLPTTDVTFTDVGRYAPLTDRRAMRASDAYLLYREPEFLIVPTVMLRSANHDLVPDALLDGAYQLSFIDAVDKNAVYKRTLKSVQRFKREPTWFLENLAHVSHVTRARINGQTVDPDDEGPALPYLREQTARFTVHGAYRAEVQIAEQNRTVREIHVNELWASQAVTVGITLRSTEGDTVFQEQFDLQPRQLGDYRAALPDGSQAASFAIEITAPPGEDTRVRVGDVRVQGQSPELAAYLERMLQFPAP